MRDLQTETKRSSPWQSCRWGHHSADGWFGVAPELYLPLEWKFGTITREEAGQKPLLRRVGNRKKNITPTTLQLLLLGLGLALWYFWPLVLPHPPHLPSASLQQPLILMVSLLPLLAQSILAHSTENNHLTMLGQITVLLGSKSPKNSSLAQSESQL